MADRPVRGRPFAACLAFFVLFAASHPAHAGTGTELPPAQAEFCRLIGIGVRAYDPLLQQWGGAGEPARRSELRDQLAQLRIARDKAVLDLLGQHRLRISDWRIGTAAKSISAVTPAGDGLSNVDLRADAFCPTPVGIETRLTVTPSVLDLLRDGSANKIWVVSGSLVPNAAAAAGPPQQLVWSASEAAAMRAPVYHLDIIEFRLSAGS